MYKITTNRFSSLYYFFIHRFSANIFVPSSRSFVRLTGLLSAKSFSIISKNRYPVVGNVTGATILRVPNRLKATRTRDISSLYLSSFGKKYILSFSSELNTVLVAIT
uniref:ORF44 n=1 Tax=Malaco herpesvirus 1 TaxID=3031797 RepID=A0AA48P7S4_9VIRU|nr:TPA_asm: ORF44 [Malaco herpesvirus 1]